LQFFFPSTTVLISFVQLLERVSSELACIDEAESSDVDRPAAPEVPDDRARTLTFAGKKRKMEEREASPEKYHPKQK
jgi:hypothetical protein